MSSSAMPWDSNRVMSPSALRLGFVPATTSRRFCTSSPIAPSCRRSAPVPVLLKAYTPKDP